MAKAKAKKSAQSTAQFTIGIDLGGTKVAAALVDSKGQIKKEVVLPTVPPWLKDQDPRTLSAAPDSALVKKHIQYVVDAMANSAFEVMSPLFEKAKTPQQAIQFVKGVGLASAGPMDVIKGTLDHPANFLGWKIVPLVDLLERALAERKLKKPVYFQNDAIAAALGEGWVGQAAGCSTYAMITVGTGIGSGVIFEGKPAQSRGMGSEWGHLMANVSGLSKSRDNYYEKTVEGLASGTGLILRAKARGFKGESARDLAEAAKKKDSLALEVFAEGSEALAALFYGLSVGFHPEKFLVSGGMLAIREHFLPQAIALYKDLMKNGFPKFTAPIQIAKLGTKAGVIGAARLPHL